VLDEISNAGGHYRYTVNWTAVARATGYTLQEDDNDAFSSPDIVYSGPNTATSISVGDVGRYYYRVKAVNNLGSSDWSNTVSTAVTQAPPDYDWTLLPTGVTETLSAVFFIDTQTGWVLGGGGTVLHSTDGGQSWQSQDSGTTQRLRDAHFVDVDHGWAIAANQILRTTDGGNTWSEQSSPIGEDFLFQSIQFVDADHGWATALKSSSPSPWVIYLYGKVLRTTDGGESWAIAEYFSTRDASRFHFVDPEHGWLISTEYDSFWKEWWTDVYVTSDGGSSWARQYGPTDTFLNAIHFIDGSTGWVVGDDETLGDALVLHTASGGSQWNEVDLGIEVDLEGVQFVGTSNGWVHSQESIWHTADAGQTWSTQTAEPGCSGFNDFCFADQYHGWIVGANGVVCKYH
jgi:photosystem II stability/assembly factor-like uncharacterized protein